MEQQIAATGDDRQISNLIDDEQAWAAEEANSFLPQKYRFLLPSLADASGVLPQILSLSGLADFRDTSDLECGADVFSALNSTVSIGIQKFARRNTARCCCITVKAIGDPYFHISSKLGTYQTIYCVSCRTR